MEWGLWAVFPRCLPPSSDEAGGDGPSALPVPQDDRAQTSPDVGVQRRCSVLDSSAR